MNIEMDPSALLTYAQSYLVQLWQNGLYGHDIRNLLIAICILSLAWLMRQPIAWVITAWLKAIVRRLPDVWLDETAVEAVRGPICALPVWTGFALANEFVVLPERQQALADNLLLSFGAFLIFWSAFKLMRPLSRHLMRLERTLSLPMIIWLTKALKGLVIFIGVASILGIWGIQIGPILAGLGLFGAAVALGSQDLFKNLIAGAMILTEKRFDIGDWILVDGVVEGDVEKIGFRSTLVRRFDKAPVYVPNAKLSDDAVTNFSRMTYRRLHWVIGLEYRTTQAQIDAVCKDIREFIETDDDFVNPDKATIFVGLEKFNESSVDILLVCFTDKIKFLDFVAVRARLGAKVKQIIESHGTGFAFPSRTVYVEGAAPDDKTMAKALGGVD